MENKLGKERDKKWGLDPFQDPSGTSPGVLALFDNWFTVDEDVFYALRVLPWLDIVCRNLKVGQVHEHNICVATLVYGTSSLHVVNLCSHDAYGIDTVRNPIWNVYWSVDRHEDVTKEFTRLGFVTGDTIGIDIDADEKPTVFRL